MQCVGNYTWPADTCGRCLAQASSRSALDWAVMANTYHLQKFLARCELFIMQRYHTNPSSKAFIPALSPESQLRIYR